MSKHLTLLAVLLLLASPAFAAVDLQITEMWVGGLDGTENTSDWFELTNFGSTAAVGLDGTLYYDDSHDDPTRDDPLTGIDSIAPGESVIFLVSWEDDFSSVPDAISAFQAMWGAPNGDLSSVQIGAVIGGRGLGSRGDAVNVFDDNSVGAGTIDREAYGDLGVNSQVESLVSDALGNWTPTNAQVDVLGAYQGNLGATDSVSEPPVASPGRVEGVPEPTMFLVFSGLALALGGTRQART